MTVQRISDVLIIGSGAAGLSCALALADQLKISLLSKGSMNEGATYYAQGGVAAVLDSKDSIASHVQDTLQAGAELCHPTTVQKTVEHSKEAIEWLINKGVHFTLKNNDASPPYKVESDYHLTREGGHSHRRIIHAADATGQAIQSTLSECVKNHKNIQIFEQYNAVDLITSHSLGIIGENNQVYGAYIFNCVTETVEIFKAKYIILATGGASKVYLYSSNPDISSGDGISIAWRSGCRVANLEFNQFHPTCLFHEKAHAFLISEALRGEGALLKLPDGTRFMHHFDPRAELAPRDIVARAIDHEIKRLGVNCLYLDISHKNESFILQHFPMIYKKLLALGIDMTQQGIPIVPAAHYTCGGVVVNQEASTDIDYLYAIGEVAFTGLHGANRIASNSLLECVVFAKKAAQSILEKEKKGSREYARTIPDWDESQVSDSDEAVVISHNWHELRHVMWNYVGLVRTNKRLERAQRRIALLKQETKEYYSHFKISSDLLELRNLITVAELIIECAIRRKESRGLHYTLDYPTPQKEKPKDTILSRVN
jgi:L-aspartate oxidase